MITAGIDMGLRSIKAEILKDDSIIASGTAASEGFNRGQAAENLWNVVLGQAGISASDVDIVISTGTGKEDVSFAANNVVEAVADVEGARKMCPDARTLIDIGAEQTRVVNYDENGKAINYTLNQMCGAGLGIFIESMARQLGVSLDGLSELAMKSNGVEPINAECGNFAALDITTMIHNNTPKEDIARAIVDAVATKVKSTANLTNIDKENIVLTGGLARNQGIVEALNRQFGVECMIPEQPEMAGAYGAAIIGAGEV
jgi:benzoyl-CoA reductase subunit D